MYSQSRKWVAPSVKEKEERIALNQARKKVCPNSPFWPVNFNIKEHKQAMLDLYALQAAEKLAREHSTTESDTDTSQPSPLPSSPASPPIRPALDGKPLSADTNHSAVLSQRTIFTPQWQQDKAHVAPWPHKPEMKYEGDDRISTDPLHRRFPAAPRVSGNETVNWQHRAVVDQWPFDDFYYPIPHPVEIWERTHRIDELEIDDDEGERLLGKELMDLLDPVDKL